LGATTLTGSTSLHRALVWFGAGLIVPAVIALAGTGLAATGIVTLLTGSVLLTLLFTGERSRSS
jgi:hypothetical protein